MSGSTKELGKALLIFLVSVLTLVLLWTCTDLADQYEARDCATSGRYTHCDH